MDGKTKLLTRLWYTKLQKLSASPDSYTFETFCKSPMVQAYILAKADLNLENETRHKLTIIIANLETILERTPIANGTAKIVEDIIRMVKELQG